MQASSKYYLAFKDETRYPAKKNLLLAVADRIDGPYKVVSRPFTPEGVWAEGPSVVRIGDLFYCYFDMYQAHRYGVMRSKDLTAWTDATEQLHFNVRDVRHGTAFAVPADVLARLVPGPAASR